MEAIHRAVLDHLSYLADHGLPMVTNKAIAQAIGCDTPHKRVTEFLEGKRRGQD